MGCAQTKEEVTSPTEKVVEVLKNKVKLLQGEINEIMCIREGENQAYEREVVVFAFKQAEWRRERKRLKGEVKKLRKILEEKEEELKCNKESGGVVGENNDDWNMLGGANCIIEKIKEEQLRRDETIEKWKQLYFAIKDELDQLIQRTHQEERVYWRTGDDDTLMELKKEMAAKEEKIEVLQAKLISMEDREFRREREVDILRQSLRIMSHKKKATSMSKGYSRNIDSDKVKCYN